MAGGFYTMDPATGLPMLPGGIALPLTEEELRASGAQLQMPQVSRPNMGPDMRVAGPGGGAADLGGADPAMAQFIAEQNRNDEAANAAAPRAFR